MINNTGWQNLAQTEKKKQSTETQRSFYTHNSPNATKDLRHSSCARLQGSFTTINAISLLNLLKNPKLLKAPQHSLN